MALLKTNFESLELHDHQPFPLPTTPMSAAPCPFPDALAPEPHMLLSDAEPDPPRHTYTAPGNQVDSIWAFHAVGTSAFMLSVGDDPLDFELLEGGNNLSGGQQQRLAILRALRVYRPVLILDEATSALDGAKRDRVFSLLRERANLGCNVLLITHDMELASQCDTVLDLAKLGLAAPKAES